jgi:two-component system sensor histidine kinase ChvG
MTSGLKEDVQWLLDDGDRASSVWEIEVPVAPGAAAFALHDAKNMLGVVSANVEYLGAELGDSPAPGVASAIEDLRASAQRLGELLREALVGLRGVNEAPRAPSSVRVLSVVTAAASRFRRRAAAAGVRVDVRAKEDPGGLIAADLLERILDNLLDNALRYSKKGDVITLTCATSEDRAMVSVEDQGPGVPEEAREAIFSAYRACGAPQGGHFGLGLAFCRAVARAYGGDVRVESREGGGARFVLHVA